ncbi:MAG: DUF2061 domain-containing protein [Candidatus Marinimicrobia bacterium]|nr:DUF2061 domain-containing protein [Candidatus Neomarinimicrobiota bacterium]
MIAFSIVGIEFFTKMLLYWGHEKVWGLSDRPPRRSSKRALVKTVTWRIVASLDTLFFVSLVTREISDGTAAALIESVTKTVAYYFHERLWDFFLRKYIVLDLHTHSTCSDGTFTPDEIIKLAQRKKCEYISITDHDNIDHMDKPKKTPKHIRYIPGVEISAEFRSTLHILGYRFNPGHGELKEVLRELQNARYRRNVSMIGKMAEKGFHISMKELLEEAGGETIGRPHFANLMLKKGYVSSYQEAFDKYLAKGMPLYMDKKRLDPRKAVQLILAAGGIPVMAHPYQTKLQGKDLEELVGELKSYGLLGIEAYYSKHSPAQRDRYLQLAKKYDLMVTAGSDFHGKNKKDIRLGLAVKKADLQPFLEAIVS